MSKVFYDHLIVIEEITAVFDLHGIPPTEQRELIQLIDKTMHHEILHIILKYLPEHHHEKFLTRFHAAPHDTSLMTYLQDRVPIDIEKEILKAANSVKKKVIKEIEAARK